MSSHSPSRFESELRIQERQRLKSLTDELAQLRAENTELRSSLSRTPSPSPMRPGWREELDGYDPCNFEERSPVDRLMEEVTRKAQLSAKIDLAKATKAPSTYVNKLESLLKRLDALHAGLSERLDGRHIAYVRANSPPASRSPSRTGSARMSPQESNSSRETAMRMREMLKERQQVAPVARSNSNSPPESQGQLLQQKKHERQASPPRSRGLGSGAWGSRSAVHASLESLEQKLLQQREEQKREEAEILARARAPRPSAEL